MVRENAYQDLNDVNINTIFAQSHQLPIVILFVVVWSGASHIMDTYIEDLAEKYQKNFHFYRQNVEKFETLSQQLKLQKLPSICIIKKGRVVESYSGILSKMKIEKKLKAAL